METTLPTVGNILCLRLNPVPYRNTKNFVVDYHCGAYY
jgi:hypothetical protein